MISELAMKEIEVREKEIHIVSVNVNHLSKKR